MKIEWLPVALQNREQQIEWLARRNIPAALSADDAIETSIGHLTTHPEMGRPGRIAGTRELVVPDTSFVVIYRAAPDRVLILRLLHGAQSWPPLP